MRCLMARLSVVMAAILLPLLAVDAKPGEDPKAKVDAQGDALPNHAIARLGSLRFRCPGGIKAIAFSPDGKVVYVNGAFTWHGPADANIIRGFAVDSGKQVVEIASVQVPGFEM